MTEARKSMPLTIACWFLIFRPPFPQTWHPSMTFWWIFSPRFSLLRVGILKYVAHRDQQQQHQEDRHAIL